MTKQHLKITLLVFVLMFSISCSNNNEPMEENSSMKTLLCANKWYEFHDSDYRIYTFDSQNRVTISYYDFNKNYRNENLTYVCTDNSIKMTNEYGRTTEYSILDSDSRYIKMGNQMSSIVIYRLLTTQELTSHLSGKWENNDGWYECYVFNPDNTFYFEQIINNNIDEEESGPGKYNIIDDVWVEFIPKNIPKYKYVFYFDEDWNLVFISPYSKTSSVFHKITSDDESSRPELTEDSPYYNEINGSKWLLFDQMYINDETNERIAGFELLEFSGKYCKKTMLFKNKSIYGGPYTNKFSIVGNTISISSYSSFEIERLSNGKLSLTDSYQGTCVCYDNDYINDFVGTWIAGDLTLTLYKDGIYSMIVYEDKQSGTIEELHNGTYSIEPGFISLDPMPSGWGNPSGYFHYITDFENGKMQWILPERDGRVKWVKTSE